MPDDHRTAMPQVTAVDDQFGTHRRDENPSEVADVLAVAPRFVIRGLPAGGAWL
jgi:hypothetical protein